MIVEIRALTPDDDRKSFRSGDEALDLYFRRYAGQNRFRHHVGVTYLATRGERILGFVTVSPASLDADDLPSGKRMPPFPIPVLRVARLAVDERVAGKGVGRALLRFAIELAETMQDEVGCVGLVVDALPEAVGFYERLGFIGVEVVEGGGAWLPRTRAMYLPLGAVPPRKDL
jgi:GNAT superfamily N-acetyltransferase